MMISDLEYLKNFDEITTVCGSAGTYIVASATAFGDTTYASTTTNSLAMKTSPNGGSVSIGFGTAYAKGDDFSTTYVDGEASGNITRVVAINDPMINGSTNFSASRIIAIGVDRPNH
jgi:hypothetical protein